MASSNEDTDDWNTVSSRRTSSRPSLGSNYSAGPPAMNTRSFAQRNFDERLAQNQNRFEPLTQRSSFDTATDPGAQHGSDTASHQRSVDSVPTTTNEQTPTTMASTQSMTTQELLYQPPEPQSSVASASARANSPSNVPVPPSASRSSVTSVHVSDASASQYSNAPPSHIATSAPFAPVANATSSPNTSNAMSASSSSNDEEIDYGSILDPPRVDYFDQIKNVLEGFANQINGISNKIDKQSQHNAECIQNLQGDIFDLRQAALLLDPTVFGANNPTPPQPSTNQRTPCSGVESGISYSPENAQAAVPASRPSLVTSSHHPDTEVKICSNIQGYNKNSSNDRELNKSKSTPQESYVPVSGRQNSSSGFRVKRDSSQVLSQPSASNSKNFSSTRASSYAPQVSHYPSQVRPHSQYNRHLPNKTVHHNYRPPSAPPIGTAYTAVPMTNRPIKNESPQGGQQQLHRPKPIMGTPVKKSPITGFNSNAFYLLLSDDAKIKFDSIDSFLSKRTLQDDSYQSLAQLYGAIFRALGVGLSNTLSFVPKFEELSTDLSFHDIFLRNLHGLHYDKAFAVYSAFGEHINDHLRSSTCINRARTPLAYEVVLGHKLLDGWSLLEELIRDRVVSCGALPDRDLFAKLMLIQLQPNESLQSFYIRLQDLENEFIILFQDGPDFVPKVKLAMRFVTELNRCLSYSLYLTNIHTDLLEYERAYGDMVIGHHPVPHSLADIYKHLKRCRVPKVPRGRLQPSPNELPTIDQRPADAPPAADQGDATQPSISFQEIDTAQQPSISHQTVDLPPDNGMTDEFLIDSWYPVEDEDGIVQPTIAALNRRRTKEFCQACLTPGHNSDKCFLRGPNFRPKELSRRLLIFNQQNGDKPPEGTVIPKWNPRTPPPILDDKVKDTSSSPSQNKPSSQSNKKVGRPFTNSPNKSVAAKPKINHLAVSPVPDEDSTNIQPSLSAFIATQEKILEDAKGGHDEFDLHQTLEDPDVVIAMLRRSQRPRSITKEAFAFFDPFNCYSIAYHETPSQISDQLQLSHQHRSNNPSAQYFKQYAANLNSLNPSTFHKFCKLHMQVDSGANVFSVYSRDVLLTFFEVETKVEAVHGEHFTSTGWGIGLCEIDGRAYLIAPVYECPDNPRNTFSPSALRKFSCFDQVMVNSGTSVHFVDDLNRKFDLPIQEHNGLDFVEMTMLSFGPNITIDPENHSLSLLTEGQDNMGGYTSSISQLHLPNLREKVEFIFPRSVMNLIAFYYVSLFCNENPREKAISTFNQLLYPWARHNFMGSLPASSVPTQQPTVSAFIGISSDKNSTIVPILAKLYRRTTNAHSDHLASYMMLHLLTQHTSKDRLITMYRKKCFRDMPSLREAEKVICNCSICNKSKLQRLPRGKLTDVSLLPPFQRIHVDFQFFGIVSLRGYSAALTVVCTSTSYIFTYPTKSKSTPLQLIRWLITTFRSCGHNPTFVRVDEDSALAECSHFCALLVELGCILETTGGYNSTNNGKVERSHLTLKNMVRASLYNAQLLFGDSLPPNLPIQKFWCFALQHAAYTLRRMYNRMRDNTPYFLVHGDRPSVNELAIFGARVVLVNPKSQKMQKLSMDRSETAFFLSFGNNVTNIIYWKSSNPFHWYRGHHAIFDDIWTLDKLKGQFQTFSSSAEIPSKIATEKDTFVDLLPMQDGPFPADEIRTCTFELPPLGTRIGLTLNDDLVYNLPFIKSTASGTIAYNNIPGTHRQNSFILNINSEGPIDSVSAVNILKTIQKAPNRTVQLDLVKRPSEARQTSLSVHRTMFDQAPNVAMRRPVISSIEPVIPDSHAHFITCATKPDKPDCIFKCLKGPYRQNWIAACKVAYHKNRQVAVFANPVPKKDLPPETRVFRTKLVPEIKATDVEQVYELKVRDCTIGTNQVKGIDFPESYCATVDPVSWKITLCVTAVICNILAVMDVHNAFQGTIAPSAFRIFTTCPPFFLEFLRETENMTFEEGVVYVRQMLNGNQGTKPASYLWYRLLKPILEKYGFVKSTVDHALFVKVYDGPQYFYICLATDDLLCSFPSWAIFDDFKQFMEKHFKLTIQTGKVLKFLGMRIIQSNLGISVDQAEYLFDLCYKHFGTGLDKLKTVTTPARYDASYEKEVFEATPLSPEELERFALEYKGNYRFHTGKFTFAACQTRGDILYATQRASEHNSAPTKIGFESIGRLYRYIAGDLLRPLFFPAGRLDETCHLTYFDGDKDIAPLDVPNELQLYSDAELARNLSDRKSYLCNVVLLMNVCILIKVSKSTTIMTHTTDSETKASFAGVRRLLPIRRLLEFMGFPCSSPTPGHVDNAALEAIISSERLTPRSRHLDIPIAYLQEHNGVSYVPRLIRTYYMLADIGTKPLTVYLHRRFKYWLMGAQFYPVPETEHYILLEMQFYEQNYVTIVRQYHG